MNGAGMEENGFDLDRIRDDILEAMLPNVIFDGWSNQSLRDAIAMTGHDGGMAQLAFPGGIPQIVEHFSGWADRRMLEELDRHDLAAMKVRDRITLAVRARLEILEPHEEAVRRALTFLALPQNTALGAGSSTARSTPCGTRRATPRPTITIIRSAPCWPPC